MLAVFQLIETIAPTSSTVLITGESGTGKELVARAIHFNSPRRTGRSWRSTAARCPETLLESELFGHMRGAFTGADSNKKGLIEVAEKGTIFLDEIGEMSPLVQVKLLRVLQERKFRRLGGTEEIERRHPRHRGDQPGSAEDGGGGHVPRGPVLPDQRHSAAAAAAARAARGHPAARRALRRQVCASRWASRSRASRAGRWRGCASTTGPATSASSRTRSSGRSRSSRRPTILPDSLPEQLNLPVGAGVSTPGPAATEGIPGRRVRPRTPRPAHRARVHRRGAQAVRRRQGQGRRAARHELPVVPLLHQEIQPQIADRIGRARLSAGGRFGSTLNASR